MQPKHQDAPAFLEFVIDRMHEELVLLLAQEAGLDATRCVGVSRRAERTSQLSVAARLECVWFCWVGAMRPEPCGNVAAALPCFWTLHCSFKFYVVRRPGRSKLTCLMLAQLAA